MSCWHLNIDYDEGVAESYRSVRLTRNGEVKEFSTGDPQADWQAYLDWATTEGITVLEGSSVTHFCFDNETWRFILNEDGKEVLVPEDRPEWLDLLNPE